MTHAASCASRRSPRGAAGCPVPERRSSDRGICRVFLSITVARGDPVRAGRLHTVVYRGYSA
jgi:hypothetical protein